MTQPPPDSREMGYYFALAQIGLEMVAPMGLGIGLDYWFGWAVVIFAAIGQIRILWWAIAAKVVKRIER